MTKKIILLAALIGTANIFAANANDDYMDANEFEAFMNDLPARRAKYIDCRRPNTAREMLGVDLTENTMFYSQSTPQETANIRRKLLDGIKLKAIIASLIASQFRKQ